MKRLSDYTGLLQGDQDFVFRLLHKWEPQTTDISEKDHETALIGWLRKWLEDVPMITQYGIARGKADIVIEDRHLIELKLGFSADNPAEFQRCLGQLETYRQKWVDKDRGPVYLLIVGESDTEFRDILHTWFKHTNAQYVTWNPFQIIEMSAPAVTSAALAASSA